MKGIRGAIAETIVVVVVGVTAGFGLNAVRGRDSIDLTRDYKPPIPATPVTTNEAGTSGAPAAAVEAGHKDQRDQAFQVVTLEEALTIYEDPNAASGLYVFVDARNDGAFESGHIPGAVQCDFYRLDDYIAEVGSNVAGAEKVVVYCNGYDCEDSLLICGELLRNDVPWEAIHLFKGGWEEWHGRDLPYVTGRE